MSGWKRWIALLIAVLTAVLGPIAVTQWRADYVHAMAAAESGTYAAVESAYTARVPVLGLEIPPPTETGKLLLSLLAQVFFALTLKYPEYAGALKLWYDAAMAAWNKTQKDGPAKLDAIDDKLDTLLDRVPPKPEVPH